VTFVLLTLLSEFVGVVGVSVSGERVYDGPMGKSDRAFAVGFFALLLYHWPGLACVLGPGLHVLSALVILSIRNRINHILAEGTGGR
jgi:CDP-diacylglycerol--glycerol-3-phosphate 3-phosphatidyltransferase